MAALGSLALSFGRFLIGTQIGRTALVALAAFLALQWYVHGERKEAAASAVVKVEKKIKKQNEKAKLNADEGSSDVHRCYRSGGTWRLQDGKCSR
jgi:hypothetical protein